MFYFRSQNFRVTLRYDMLSVDIPPHKSSHSFLLLRICDMIGTIFDLPYRDASCPSCAGLKGAALPPSMSTLLYLQSLNLSGENPAILHIALALLHSRTTGKCLFLTSEY
jgi:hypothetical protein